MGDTTGPNKQSIWVDFGRVEEFAVDSMQVVRHDGKQFLVICDQRGSFVVLDNRCPHEGYPLHQGERRGSVLTCLWHNWKFRLPDGVCTFGGEDVASYATRVQQGHLQIELQTADPARTWPTLQASLYAAVQDNDLPRAFRDVARLLNGGYPLDQLLLGLMREDAVRSEEGSSHILAIAADCRWIARDWSADDGGNASTMTAIAPVMELSCESLQRLPVQPRPAAKRGANERTLTALIEAEKCEEAQSLIFGAFDQEVPPATVAGWLYSAIAEHFLSFGHPLIYLVKWQQFFESIDRKNAPREMVAETMAGLVKRIILSTREDRLPYLRPYFDHVQPWVDLFPRFVLQTSNGTSTTYASFHEAFRQANRREVIELVGRTLESGASTAEICDHLVGLAAERLLRFDARIDRDATVAEGWLWVTHRLTFANAVRHALRRFRHPKSIQFLFQSAAFIHSGLALDGDTEANETIVAEPFAALNEAVRLNQADRAVSILRAHLRENSDPSGLIEALTRLSVVEGGVRPVFLAHAIKTVVVGLEERRHLKGHPAMDEPLCAAIRYLASPVTERSALADAQTAWNWVVNGTMPVKRSQ